MVFQSNPLIPGSHQPDMALHLAQRCHRFKPGPQCSKMLQWKIGSTHITPVEPLDCQFVISFSSSIIIEMMIFALMTFGI